MNILKGLYREYIFTSDFKHDLFQQSACIPPTQFLQPSDLALITNTTFSPRISNFTTSQNER